MRQVWKYPLDWTAEPQTVAMPVAAKPGRFAVQDGVPTLWAEVETSSIAVPRLFVIVGTGADIPFPTYRGTVDHNGFVFHLYEAGL